MFTLVYSALAAQGFGFNTARTTPGEVVKYTAMYDQVEYGNWKDSYRWEDAVVVGTCNSYNDIISINHMKCDEWYWR